MPGPPQFQKLLTGKAGKIPMRPDHQAGLVRTTGYYRSLPISFKGQKAQITPQAMKRICQKFPVGSQGTCHPRRASLGKCLRTKITLGWRVCTSWTQGESWEWKEGKGDQRHSPCGSFHLRILWLGLPSAHTICKVYICLPLPSFPAFWNPTYLLESSWKDPLPH